MLTIDAVFEDKEEVTKAFAKHVLNADGGSDKEEKVTHIESKEEKV